MPSEREASISATVYPAAFTEMRQVQTLIANMAAGMAVTQGMETTVAALVTDPWRTPQSQLILD